MNTKLSAVVTAIAGAVGALALSVSLPTAAQASTYIGGCSVTDVSPTAGACYGYFVGNALGGSSDNLTDQATALAALGLAGPYTTVQHIDLTDPTIDFDALLNGVTYIGIHWGKGQGPADTKGGATGFYRLDLAGDANLDTITAAFGSQSGASLYSTQPCVGEGCDNNPGGFVPEPATWAMMIMGFGGVGALVRRRRDALTVA